jgi:alpha-glucosidase
LKAIKPPLSTDEAFGGKQSIQAAAPLTDLPVFIKAGAIIPMQNVIQNTSEKGDGILTVHIWNGEIGNSFTYYEDDGSTYQNEKGIYYQRAIRFNPVQKQINFEVVKGSYSSRFQQIRLVLHGFPKTLKSIKLNGKSAKLNLDAEGNRTVLTTNSKGEIRVQY